jgi:hypothetical protein
MTDLTVVPADGPSVGSQVQLPVRLVTLTQLKTRDGQAVVVQCERIPRSTISRIVRHLPGEYPRAVASAADDPERERSAEELDQAWAQFFEFAPALIEAATVLQDEGGREIRPAFYFGEPRPGALPGRLLVEEDMMLMVTAIYELCAYGGGGAPASFHGEGGVGGADRLGAVPAGAAEGGEPA